MKTSLEKLLIKNKGKTLSGEFIARSLGITRAGVWKKIKNLQYQGYCITAQHNRGYCLQSSHTISDLKNFTFPSVKFHYYRKLGSTQTTAKELAINNAPERTLICAGTQFGSYGRMGRTWASPKGGLWFSIILKPHKTPAETSTLTLIMGLSVAQALKSLFPELQINVKWPNDVIINSKKICGIISEMQSELDSVKWLVIGVGLNINNTLPETLQHSATTLKKEINTEVSLSLVFEKLLSCFLNYYKRFNISGMAHFLPLYKKYSMLTDKKVLIIMGNEKIEGIIKGINKAGGLLIKTPHKPVYPIYAGEIAAVR